MKSFWGGIELNVTYSPLIGTTYSFIFRVKMKNESSRVSWGEKLYLDDVMFLGRQDAFFIYKISELNFSDELINDINSIVTRSKIRDRLNRILALGGEFEFVNTERVVFSNNLILIDSLLPQIISEMVFQFYSNGLSSVSELVQVVEDVNPIKFDQSHKHQFYSYKIKRFLTDVALGMMPATVWTGQYDATGGYLVVKEDGDILCYHIYNINNFENYLLNHTKLDTASSTRHEFGQIYEEAGEVFMKLNLQIRFVK